MPRPPRSRVRPTAVASDPGRRGTGRRTGQRDRGCRAWRECAGFETARPGRYDVPVFGVPTCRITRLLNSPLPSAPDRGHRDVAPRASRPAPRDRRGWSCAPARSAADDPGSPLAQGSQRPPDRPGFERPPARASVVSARNNRAGQVIVVGVAEPRQHASSQELPSSLLFDEDPQRGRRLSRHLECRVREPPRRPQRSHASDPRDVGGVEHRVDLVAAHEAGPALDLGQDVDPVGQTLVADEPAEPLLPGRRVSTPDLNRPAVGQVGAVVGQHDQDLAGCVRPAATPVCATVRGRRPRGGGRRRSGNWS